MQIVQEISLISKGSFEESQDWAVIQNEIRSAINLIVWPPGNSNFIINPTRHGNGVKPIKNACMTALKENFGWQLETQIRYATRSPGSFDMTVNYEKRFLIVCHLLVEFLLFSYP